MLVWLNQPYSVFRPHLIICVLQSLHTVNKLCGCFQPWTSMDGSTWSRTLRSSGALFLAPLPPTVVCLNYIQCVKMSTCSCGMRRRRREGERKKDGGEEKDRKKDYRKRDKRRKE